MKVSELEKKVVNTKSKAEIKAMIKKMRLEYEIQLLNFLKGEEIMKVSELKKKVVNTKSKAEVEAMIKKMRAEDEKLVKGMFEFTEAEGGFFEFSYRLYPGDAIQTYQFVHGEICTIPMGIVKHLNGTHKKVRRYMNVEQPPTGGVLTPKTYDSFSRVRFVPEEYLNLKAS